MQLEQVYKIVQDYQQKERDIKAYFPKEDTKEILKELREITLKRIEDVLYPIN